MDKKKVPFQEIVAALLDNDRPFTPVYLHRFSDIPDADLEALKKIWKQIAPARRAALMSDLDEMQDNDTLLSFESLARFALTDSEASVRKVALDMLWDAEALDLLPTFIRMLENDLSPEVRAAAATALGIFIYKGELEEIPQNALHDVEEILLKVATGSDVIDVRRHALESLGYSSRDELPALIKSAYESGNREWKISALFAMGRSADQAWAPVVMKNINHPDPDIQVEAVRAAGELELESAREPLLELITETLEDQEVRMATAWALSQIGGEGVREALEKIAEDSEDDEETDFIETALENLEFTTDFHLLSMEFDELDPETLDSYLDLSESEDEDPDKDNK